VEELFGNDRPTVADFEAVLADGDLYGFVYEQWGGRSAVLHDSAGAPVEAYFWGWSGD
jgi:hypothetical protein